MKDRTIVIGLGLILLLFSISGIITLFSNSNDQNSQSGIVVAISPNGTYEYQIIGDNPISKEESQSLIKEAMKGKGDNINITNGTIYGEKVTVKNLGLNGTPITLAYFKGNNTPSFNENTLSSIIKFDYISALLRATKVNIEYRISLGEMTTTEGKTALKNKTEQILNDTKTKYPEITVYWDN